MLISLEAWSQWVSDIKGPTMDNILTDDICLNSGMQQTSDKVGLKWKLLAFTSPLCRLGLPITIGKIALKVIVCNFASVLCRGRWVNCQFTQMGFHMTWSSMMQCNIAYNSAQANVEYRPNISLTKVSPIACQWRWAMGCLSWGFEIKLII